MLSLPPLLQNKPKLPLPLWLQISDSAFRTPHSFDSRQPFFPNLVEQHGGFHVAQAIFSDLTMPALRNQRVHVPASHALAFRRFNPKRLAIKIEIESPRRPISSADAIKSKLF